MTELTSAQELFKGRHFDQEIIVLCVRWYLTFKLSSRDLVQLMAERGISLTHTTILRWVQHYVPEFETPAKRSFWSDDMDPIQLIDIETDFGVTVWGPKDSSTLKFTEPPWSPV